MEAFIKSRSHCPVAGWLSRTWLRTIGSSTPMSLRDSTMVVRYLWYKPLQHPGNMTIAREHRQQTAIMPSSQGICWCHLCMMSRGEAQQAMAPTAMSTK